MVQVLYRLGRTDVSMVQVLYRIGRTDVSMAQAFYRIGRTDVSTAQALYRIGRTDVSMAQALYRIGRTDVSMAQALYRIGRTDVSMAQALYRIGRTDISVLGSCNVWECFCMYFIVLIDMFCVTARRSMLSLRSRHLKEWKGSSFDSWFWKWRKPCVLRNVASKWCRLKLGRCIDFVRGFIDFSEKKNPVIDINYAKSITLSALVYFKQC